MKHVHWIGTGLSSIPGIRRLANLLIPGIDDNPVPIQCTCFIVLFTFILNCLLH